MTYRHYVVDSDWEDVQIAESDRARCALFRQVSFTGQTEYE